MGNFEIAGIKVKNALYATALAAISGTLIGIGADVLQAGWGLAVHPEAHIDDWNKIFDIAHGDVESAKIRLAVTLGLFGACTTMGVFATYEAFRQAYKATK